MNLRNGKEKPTTPLDAIKEFCLECCGYQKDDVKNCTAPMCALYNFRLGKNPYRKTKDYSEDELEKMRERIRKAREKKNEKS